MALAVYVLCSAAFADDAKSTLDYVQDGLVAQWDAIENVGRGVHSDTITAWKDLVSTNDVPIPDWVTVEENALYSKGAITGHTPPVISGTAIPTDVDITIEIVMKRVGWTSNTSYNNIQMVLYSPYGLLGYRSTDYNGFCFMLSSSSTRLQNYDWKQPGAYAVDINTISAAVSKSTEANSVYLNGIAASGVSKDSYSEDSQSDWFFFGNLRSDLRVYSIRIYNRRLSQAEIQANCEIDSKRFYDQRYALAGTPRFAETTFNSSRISCDVPSAAALPVTAKFTSGFQADLLDGVTRNLGSVAQGGCFERDVNFSRGPKTFCRVDLVDAEGVEYTGDICEIPGDDRYSYVRHNLIARWDGIDNAGVGMHDDSPTVWKNLVDNPDIPLPSWVSVESNAMVSLGSGVDSAAVPAIASLAGDYTVNVTIEVVAQRIRWLVDSKYYSGVQVVVGSPLGIIGFRNADGYVTYMPDGGTLYLNESGTAVGAGSINTFSLTTAGPYGGGSLRKNSVSLSTSRLNYSCQPSNWYFFENGRTDLRICAIRIYNDCLGVADLATNAMVDARRFINGDIGDPATLEIASDEDVGSALATGGYWLLAGESVVSRAPLHVRTADAVFTRHGWTRYIEQDGEWIEAERGVTDSVAIVSDPPARQRLVWHWLKTVPTDGLPPLDNTVTVVGVDSAGASVEAGDPLIPYGVTTGFIADEVFSVGDPEECVIDGKRCAVKSILRYDWNSGSGQWALSDTTRGRIISATFDGMPVKYVLKWRPQGLMVIYR